MIATLIGGTGLTGSILLRQLLDDRAITRVISVGRKPIAQTHPKLSEVVIADLAELPSIEAKLRGDLYFCCLGTTIKQAGSQANFEKVDHDAVAAFAAIARAHDARAFVYVSAMAAKADSLVFYNRVKGRTEAAVKALGLRSLTIFQPAFLVGPRPPSRPTERLLMKLVVPPLALLPQRLRKLLLTDAQTLATRMRTEALAAPSGTHVIPSARI